MLFQTWEFLTFFLVLLCLYAVLYKTALRLPLLLLASYVFYGWFDLRFLIFLAIITGADYLLQFPAASQSTAKKRFALLGSCVINLGILCSFKYLGFLSENIQSLLNLFHLEWEIPETDWILPVGLSFFTFKSLSHTCDVYWGKLPVEKNLLLFASYVAFFPQIVAGPIERASTLLPQLKTPGTYSKEDLSTGFCIFFSGLFKKAVLADLLAVYVNQVYDDPSTHGGAALLYASYAFSWQIYFDFAGYSDMARGVARMLGFRTIMNFDNPYVAVSVRDFWRRWHISLSSWFRDYVYIPLGGGRRCKIRVWWNVMVTMLVSGLWHGAAWTFIVWGGLNGIGSVISSEIDKKNWYQRIPKLLLQILTFHFITLTWVFFRASSFEDAFTVLKGIFTWAQGENPTPFPWLPLILVGMVWIYQLVWDSSKKHLLQSRTARIVTFAIMLLLFLLLGSGANTQFIYQQF